jgi:acetyl-CoA acetyltransferase
MGDAPSVAIVGTGYSTLARRQERPLVLLARDAALRAVADAGIALDQVDGLATYPVLAPQTEPDIELVTVPSMQEVLQLHGKVRWYCEPHEGMAGAGVVAAYHALRSGACEYAIVWRALHMPKTGRYNAAPPREVSGHSQFLTPYGLQSYNALFSMLYTRYFELYGASREMLAPVAVHQRVGANLNEDAVFRDVPLSVDDYLGARMITDAMCLYDCDIPIDGACAIVMTTGDRAKDLDASPAWIKGIVAGGPREAELWDLEAVQSSMDLLSARLWKSTGLGPGDMDAAMLYDGFSLFPVLWLEGLGFCATGEGLEYIQNGRIALGGELPVNTGGGSLSQGRLHGLAHVIEGARQVTGKANRRQVGSARHVVCTVAFNSNGMALVLGADEEDGGRR